MIEITEYNITYYCRAKLYCDFCEETSLPPHRLLTREEYTRAGKSKIACDRCMVVLKVAPDLSQVKVLSINGVYIL